MMEYVFTPAGLLAWYILALAAWHVYDEIKLKRMRAKWLKDRVERGL